MSALELLFSSLVLLALPEMAHRSGLRLAPQDWARSTLWTSLGALAILEAAAVSCAISLLPTVAERHFFPGGAIAGWVSLGIAVAVPARFAVVIVRSRRRRRLLRAENWLGTHVGFGGVEVVVLPVERPLALSIPGRSPQIVISRHTLRTLEPDELTVVLRHEVSHLDHHHTRYLALAEAVGPMVRWAPIVGRPLARLPMWIERWADDDSAPTPEAREYVRSSIGRFITTDLGSAATSMSPAETIEERIHALEAAPLPTKPRAWVAVIVSAMLVFAAGVAPLIIRILT